MKKLFVPVLFMMFAVAIHAQWVSNIGSQARGDVNFENAKSNAITTDSYGYSYVTGKSFEGNANLDDIIIIKYNPEGDTVWVRTYNGSASQNDEGFGICVDGDGNVFVVGTTASSITGNDLTILKYNSDGVEEWVKPYYNFNANRTDKGLAISVDRDLYIYVTGFGAADDGTERIVTLKYDQSGGLLWHKEFGDNPGYNSNGNGIAVNSSGEIYVVGFTGSEAHGSDIVLMKYSSSGALLWSKTKNGSGNSEDKAWGIVVDEDGNAYISGWVTDNVGGVNTFTAKYSTDGDTLWSKTYNGGEGTTDKAWGIVVDTDGSVVVTGESNGDYITIAYDPNGDQLWAKDYNGTGNGIDVSSAIGIVTSANNTKSVVITGKSWGTADNYDYATVRYDYSNGYQIVVNRYSMSGISNDVAKDIAITDDNKVLITGYSQLIIEAMSEVCYVSTMQIEWGESSELATQNNTPGKYSLQQNYPNPFNPTTNIKFEIGNSSQVKLVIYDMVGRVAAVLVNQQLDAGSYNISYTNLNLSSGVYFYELRAGNYRDVKKMTLIK